MTKPTFRQSDRHRMPCGIRRLTAAMICCTAVLARADPQPPATRPTTRPAPQPLKDDNLLTSRKVNASIQKGVDFLVSQFDPKRFELKQNLGDTDAHHSGLDALYVYTLLHCGQSVNDPRLSPHSAFMRGIIDALKRMPMAVGPVTYARALRIAALSMTGRDDDAAVLRADADYLLHATNSGGYSYDKHPGAEGRYGQPDGEWDNSNSQYGMLGVWNAADAGVPVPVAYWQAVQSHWASCQLSNGLWGYRGRDGPASASMTFAGIASLFVAHDVIDPHRDIAGFGQPALPPELEKPLGWLEQGDNAINFVGSRWGYTLYGLERVGLASGFKRFGKHDWYVEMSRRYIALQNADGSWGDSEENTPFTLLFLARGNRPILVNKLRFDGAWANRPRDAANLTAFASRELERAANWQIVSLADDWPDWTDSSILYLASHEPPKLGEGDIAKLRAFVCAGGLLFTQADGGSQSFNDFAAALAVRLFPGCAMTDMPASHPIYSIQYKIDPRLPLKMVSNGGGRLLMIHSPADLARAWQNHDIQGQRPAFELGVNLMVLAAGRRDFRSRLEMNDLPPILAPPLATVKVARLKYGGAWDPEPYAWVRFAHQFQLETSYAIEPVTVPLDALQPESAPLAHLTGAARAAFTPQEVEAVHKYVEGGGVLLVDDQSGNATFAGGAWNDLLAPALPGAALALLDANHPLLHATGPGMAELSLPRLRPTDATRPRRAHEEPFSAKFGAGHVIVTPVDLTCGLLGSTTWGIVGYTPADSRGLARNLIFWTVDGGRDQ